MRILLIDDDSDALAYMEQILKSMGNTVDSSTSPNTALRKFWQGPQNYDVVITDVRMMEMDGEVLTERVKEKRPDIPIIFITGLGDHANTTSLLRVGQVLHKWEPPGVMQKLLREMLM